MLDFDGVVSIIVDVVLGVWKMCCILKGEVFFLSKLCCFMLVGFVDLSLRKMFGFF